MSFETIAGDFWTTTFTHRSLGFQSRGRSSLSRADSGSGWTRFQQRWAQKSSWIPFSTKQRMGWCEGIIFRNLGNGRESWVGVSCGPGMLGVPIKNAPWNFLICTMWGPCFVLLLLLFSFSSLFHSVGIAVRSNNAGNLRHFFSCVFF